MDEKTFKRFTAKVRMPETADGCMEWTAGRHEFGYGQLTVGGKTTSTHRLSYEHFVGPIPEGMQVRHACDNPCCVRPDHFSIGTIADNMRDKTERGRQARGEKQYAAKLTEEQVQEIRNRYACGATHQKIADEFGVARTNVGMILRGDTWSYLPVPAACAAASKSCRYGMRLSDDQVRQIRQRYATGGFTHREIADEFGVSRSNVGMIVSGKTHRSVTTT